MERNKVTKTPDGMIQVKKVKVPEDQFKIKFISSRDNKGEPQTEALRYVREFLTELEKDPRFSGATIVGSTMKGYGHKSSDIDLMVFFYDPSQDIPYQEKFITNFNKLEKKFRENKNYDSFIVDTFPTHFFNLYEILQTTQKGVTVTKEKLSLSAIVLYVLSYPIMPSEQDKVFMPMSKFIALIKKTIQELSPEEKRQLLDKVTRKASIEMVSEFNKYADRKNIPVEREQEYIKSRIALLRNQLRIKFGLE